MDTLTMDKFDTHNISSTVLFLFTDTIIITVIISILILV